MGNVEAGWYDDGSGNQRWWDGDRWTDDYADMTGTRVELRSSPLAPSAPKGPGWYDDHHGRLRWWDGLQWTSRSQPIGEQHGFAGITVAGNWIHYGDLSQPVAGVMASYETGGDIVTRSTFARALAGGVLFGPTGAITAASLKTSVHRRQFYVAIDGLEQFWVVPIPQRLAVQARQFVGWVETVSRDQSRR